MIVADLKSSRIVQLERRGDPFSRFDAGKTGDALTLRVALMRPIAEAERSAALLRARGFEPIVAPVLEVRGTGDGPAEAPYNAVLATSANAFAFLDPAARARLQGLPLYVAGERTAAAALAIGLGPVEGSCADASALAAVLAARLPRSSRLLYLAGRERKGALEAALGGAGHDVVAIEVYVAEARAWSAAEVAGVARCEAALHYSRRSAELSIALCAEAGLADHWRATLHGCISLDAAEPLRANGAKRIVTASSAQESFLIDALLFGVKTG
jgi:uroporphyrinogen-III synthase